MVDQKYVLDFCNKVRKAGGGEVLDSLMPGVPLNTESCLVARNLNFNCEIMPTSPADNFNNWVMYISSYGWTNDVDIHETADRISEATGMKVIDRANRSVRLRLPVELGEVAYMFDRSWKDIEAMEEKLEDCVESGYMEEAKDISYRMNQYRANVPPWILELQTANEDELEYV